MPIRYAHTNIVAEDWQRLARFYQEVLGCEPVPPERDLTGEALSRATGVPEASLTGIHLRLPGQGPNGPTLEIYQYTQMEPRPAMAANRKGYGHLAFEVEDVAAMHETVLAHGGQPLGEVVQRAIPGVGQLTFVYAGDPEGNILELQRWD